MITTIRQTVDIPAGHRLRLDLELPEMTRYGTAEVTILIKKPIQPAAKTTSGNDVIEALLKPFPPLEEFKREAAEKTAKRIARGREPFEEARELLHGRQLFDGIDGVEYQRKLRDEWPD